MFPPHELFQITSWAGQVLVYWPALRQVGVGGVPMTSYKLWIVDRKGETVYVRVVLNSALECVLFGLKYRPVCIRHEAGFHQNARRRENG
jgi:hypothetical protein